MTTSEKLAKIMELSVQINSDTEFAVFCDFSGHVSLLNVRISKSKKLTNEVLAHGNWFLSLGDEPKLDGLINTLELIKQHHAIPGSLQLENPYSGYESDGYLYRTKLSQGCNLNESTLINTSTEAYLSFDKAAREA